MTEVTKLTTFKDVVSVPSFITYVKATAADEIVFPEHGVASAILTTNGTLEAWAYKSVTIANAVTSQTAGTRSQCRRLCKVCSARICLECYQG